MFCVIRGINDINFKFRNVFFLMLVNIFYFCMIVRKSKDLYYLRKVIFLKGIKKGNIIFFWG